jgi:acyl-CoA oxidase
LDTKYCFFQFKNIKIVCAGYCAQIKKYIAHTIDQRMSAKDSPFTPGVVSFLPVFYVGWKDSILSTTEMKYIHKLIAKMDHLTDSEKSYLIGHTDPQNPPGKELYKEWLQIIREKSKALPISERLDLIHLSASISKPLIDNMNDGDLKKVRKAIKKIAQAMGVEDANYFDQLMLQIGLEIEENSEHHTFSSKRLHELLFDYRVEARRAATSLLNDPLYQIDEEMLDKFHLREATLVRVKSLAQQGLGALAFPLSCGGRSDIGSYITVFQTIASHDLNLAVKFGVQFGLYGGAILGLGTKKHHDKYLEDTGKAITLGCFAMTETGHGSNVKDLETTATYNHAEKNITINSPTKTAGKEYIGNALHSTMSVVFAQLIVEEINHGIHAIVVPLREASHTTLEGITIEDCGTKMGLNGIDNGRIWFDYVKVPVENLLNKYGTITENGQYQSSIDNDSKRFFTMLGALVGGRISVGLGAARASMTSLQIAIEYSLRRRQFGSEAHEKSEFLIMDYPTHMYRLIPRTINTIIYHQTMQMLAAEFANGPDEHAMRKIETKAAGLKAVISWLATDTIQECREACGGKGYLAENSIARLKADSDIFTTFEGDNTVLMQLVAKGLLTEFKDSFHEDTWSASLNYVSNLINFKLTELNPYFARKTSVKHLESHEFLSEALRYREKKIIMSLADRMRNYIKKQLTPHQAFIKCQIHMVDAARAYIDRLAYRYMIRKIETLASTEEKKLIERMLLFYALDKVYTYREWYMENDYFGGQKSKALRRVYDKHILSFRKDISGIIKSLGVNERVYRVKF